MRRLAGFGLAMGAVGCSPGFDGVWWLELTQTGVTVCMVSINESFVEAEPRTIAPDEGPPAIDAPATRDAYALINTGFRGDVFVNFEDQTYRGSETPLDSVTAQWDTESSITDVRMDIGDYLYTVTETETAEENLEFSVADAGLLVGRLTRVAQQITRYNEDDTWEEGPARTSIENDIYLAWLTGRLANLPSREDCEDDCVIEVTQRCTTTYELEAVDAGRGGIELYQALTRSDPSPQE